MNIILYYVIGLVSHMKQISVIVYIMVSGSVAFVFGLWDSVYLIQCLLKLNWHAIGISKGCCKLCLFSYVVRCSQGGRLMSWPLKWELHLRMQNGKLMCTASTAKNGKDFLWHFERKWVMVCVSVYIARWV